MTNRDDRDTFDLDETAELPKITHETTDIPRFGFPKDQLTLNNMMYRIPEIMRQQVFLPLKMK